MSLSLRGQTVLITGASAGIGLATAMEFAKLGCRLLLCARPPRAVCNSRSMTCERPVPPMCFYSSSTCSAEDDVQGVIGTLPTDWQQVDVLVNNAGLSRGLTKLWEDDVDNWEEMIDTNVKGLLYVTRAVVPGMVKRGHGHIINLGSIAGHMAYPQGGVYCASKAAERSISDGLRIDLKRHAIARHVGGPGYGADRLQQGAFSVAMKSAPRRPNANIDPLQPEDVADAIVWAATRPAHVSIQTVVITPTAQANPFVITRKS